MPEEDSYDEAKNLVDHVRSFYPFPGKMSLCLWYYCKTYETFLKGSHFYSDVVDAIEDALLSATVEEDRDHELAWVCVEHVCRDIVLPKFRGRLCDASNLDALDQATLHLTEPTTSIRIERIEAIHSSLGALLEEHLVGLMENVFARTGQRDASLIRSRNDEKMKKVLQGTIRIIEEMSRSDFPLVGALTAVLDFRFSPETNPADLALRMMNLAPPRPE